MKSKRLFSAASFFIFFCWVLSFSLQKMDSVVPPNEPAKIDVKGDELTVEYDHKLIFRGQAKHDLNKIQTQVCNFTDEGRINQIILFNSYDYEKKIRISGTIYASEESFPCESDRREKGLLLVRHSSGLSRSLLNRAVYDRKGDWVLSVDANPEVLIEPLKSENKTNAFSVNIEGSEIILRFRPRYYQKHRGLKYFEPWSYKVWQNSVAGWISWFAFFDKVTERDVIQTADTLSEVLLPFGYEYLQIDDGYQRGEGLPELWLKANEKFPLGLRYLAHYIRSKGLTPGIWTNVSFKQKDFAENHKDWFVRDSRGKVAKGNWIDFSLDASNPEALNTIVRPVYRGLRDMGWEYFKVDALRHLRYEGYNANNNYFKQRKLDLVDIYRRYLKAIRDEIGRDYFMLGCWGIRPELVGIIDGCRIGTDGFSYAGLSQYNSFNNVVWRNDPDHIQLNDDAYRSCLVTSLTGSLLLLTDEPEIYRTPLAEPAKRVAPVLFTLPGQIYDVDPSRSENIGRADSEVSGSGTRVFDAGRSPACHLYLLEVNRPFEYWTVLGRTGGEFKEIKFNELGSDKEKEYFVFEFWTKKLLGSFTESFPPGSIDPRYKSQVFCFRERKGHPQLIATNRHMTCGGTDLLDVKWGNNALAGRSKIVGNDVYQLFITEPEGYEFEKFECEAANLEKVEKEGMILKISILSKESKEISWSAKFILKS